MAAFELPGLCSNPDRGGTGAIKQLQKLRFAGYKLEGNKRDDPRAVLRDLAASDGAVARVDGYFAQRLDVSDEFGLHWVGSSLPAGHMEPAGHGSHCAALVRSVRSEKVPARQGSAAAAPSGQ